MSSHIAEDSFLDLAKSEAKKITIGIQTLPKTIFLEGIITDYDDNTIILETTGLAHFKDVIIYKHAIATIST